MAKTEFKYDVFVSYSSANKDWVRKTFVPILEIAGLKVCDYYRDFDVGASIVKEMERAVLESSKTIPVLSPAYLNSGWTEFESLMLQTLDAANRERKLLPVILESCELPLRIKYMNCINFANPDDAEIEWQRLSRGLGVTLSPTITPKSSTISNWYLAHPYPMPPNFTGRLIERATLSKWLNEDAENRLFIIRALGGFGKSALTWHWLTHDVDIEEFPKVAFWSFYEGDASFEHFIEETLKYLKLEIPQGQRPQVDELLKTMQSQKILLIMDGFERALRAYSSMNAAYQADESPLPEGEGKGEGDSNQLDCVNINAEIFLRSLCSLPNIKSKVLMTTRLTPRAVKPRGEFMLGCHEEELTAMQKVDAVEFFHKQKIKGTHAELEAACAPYGYHPLSLRLLAGRILKDFENPADIVVAQKLKIDGDLKQQKHHVLEVSYDSLPKHEQKLLSTIACFRWPVELKTLQSIAENKNTLDNDLHDLVERGLLQHTIRPISNHPVSTFDLHPIVRRYAYERLTVSDQTFAHSRLRDYFAVVDVPEQVKTLEDLAPVIELYHHTVRARIYDEAFEIFYVHLNEPLYFQFGAYQAFIELQSSLFDEKTGLPKFDEEFKRARVLNDIAGAYALSGQPSRAVTLVESYVQISQRRRDEENEAVGLGNLATQQLVIGSLSKAESSLLRSINLCQGLNDEWQKAVSQVDLGQVLSYRGVWQEADENLMLAQKVFDNEGPSTNYGSVNLSYFAMKEMLMARAESQTKISHYQSANQFATRALKWADRTAHTRMTIPADYIRAYWLLGSIYRENRDLNQSEKNLFKAIDICRRINSVIFEANILLDLARLRYDQKKYEEAKSLAEEALTITERCGYVLQGADVNLFLAQYALEQEKDKVKAKACAEIALKLATCDGPPYYYKVAYEEAERMLAGL